MPIISATLSNAVRLISRKEPVIEPPLPHASGTFTLDSSGVAGFFGGESAVRAMATVNLLPQRRWCGWYNAPGSYEVAKQYGPLARSDIFDGLFPRGQRNAAKILMIDGQVGSKCIPVHSPAADFSRVGHLGYLLERKVGEIPIKKAFPRTRHGRHTMDAHVSLLGLNHMPDEFEYMEPIKTSSITFALGTILISTGGCVACALIGDWFSFASIALGIIANGVACSVIGSGQLILKHNIPAQAEGFEDVVLKGDTGIIVLLGSSGAVSPFIRDRFILDYDRTPHFEPEKLEPEDTEDAACAPTNVASGGMPCRRCNRPLFPCDTCCPSGDKGNRGRWPRVKQEYLVRVSVVLLLSQFLAQLLLIPQGTLFGQLMFLATLVPSWMYHSYLSSLSLDFQTQTLFQKLRIEPEDINRYQLNTWTEAVVFACLALASVRHTSFDDSAKPIDWEKNIQGLLDGLLPNKTDVWQTWKMWLAKRIVEVAQLENKGESMPSRLYTGRERETAGRNAGDQHTGHGAGQVGEQVAGQAAAVQATGQTGEQGATGQAGGQGAGQAGGQGGAQTAGTQGGVGHAREDSNRDSKRLQGADLKQLQIYQDDANRALQAWGTVRDNKEIRSLRYTARDGVPKCTT